MRAWRQRLGQLPNDDFDDRAVITNFFGPSEEDHRHILHGSNIDAVYLLEPRHRLTGPIGLLALNPFLLVANPVARWFTDIHASHCSAARETGQPGRPRPCARAPPSGTRNSGERPSRAGNQPLDDLARAQAAGLGRQAVERGLGFGEQGASLGRRRLRRGQQGERQA